MKLIRIILILCLSITMMSCIGNKEIPDIIWTEVLGIMDIDGTNIQYIASESYNYNSLMRRKAHFTPDGKYLTNGRHIMNLDGSGYKQLVPDSLDIFKYCFDNITENMYLVSTIKNNRYLCKININNNSVNIIYSLSNLNYHGGDLTISNDNNKLFLPFGNRFHIYYLDSDSLVSLDIDGWTRFAIFANNDTELIYINHNQGGIGSVNIYNNETMIIAPRGSLELSNQDANRFVCETGTGNIEMLELNNGTYNYSIINNVPAINPSINKAGDKVLYHLHGIIINYLDGIGEQVIYSKSVPKAIISPTGDKVLFYQDIKGGDVSIGKNYGVGL